ncbi:MAG: BON domain-containing protein [Kiritimatiellae bacterium]|nr:BON domain-containing protein [Kiritimatiellia bacterium]MDW8458288.1 BON domain-containing protein [Verrucomicrobiota bacterium]
MAKGTVSFLAALIAVAWLVGAAGCATVEEAGRAVDGPAAADRDLSAMIRHRIEMDSGLRGQMIGIDVAGGEVTVRGNVRNEAERLRLLGIIRGTPGVAVVHDQLRVVR